MDVIGVAYVLGVPSVAARCVRVHGLTDIPVTDYFSSSYRAKLGEEAD